ncbi:two-component system, OmpR family, sensor histidine kinase MtrB [Promicromonospora umidemergens]|uniref:Sensor histidine kinase MtrB n=1 Tax=Promicromonospora umidemergens TaxID=629679 RepID=A0ABP8YBD6_9MICO|nr:MtrAB system histidine kinase MtrB [Promicromonospora umidemergens]MCP2284696.1 two-component system, OmpR family, sensor histidine kinase MtrB [Promicromonospora umidemergens]
MPHGLVTRLRRVVPRARVVAVRSARRGVAQWRSSLQLRVVTTALAIGFAAIAVLGLYLSTSVRDGIYEQRLAAIDGEAAALTAQVAQNFSETPTTSDGELQQLLLDTIATLGATSGSTAEEYFLLQEEGGTAQVADVASRADLTDLLITSELRDANIASDDDQVLQAVGIPATADPGMVGPGVIVGSTVQASPDARYEIYYLYSLEPEQETLSFVHRVLLAGGFGMLALLGVVTWTMARQTVTPVTRAATVAERLAEGHLSERMPGARGTDEMASLARSFNEMAESLQDQILRMEELSAMQRRFVSDVSHELRTPLTTIRMASEIIHESRQQMDEDAARSAELLLGQIDRFESLLSDLLEISRFDAGAAVLDAERRDLRDLVMSVVEQAAPLANSKDVRVSVRLPDADAAADFDPRRIERILRNLVVNAIEHAEERPVEVTVAEDDRAVAVVVRDYGVGMTKQEVEHVFDRFWRADPARARTTGGSGLGLAIALEDARLHSGRLDAWGRPGQGASFRLTLPRSAGVQVGEPPVTMAPASHEPGLRTGQIPVVNPSAGPTPTAIPDLSDPEGAVGLHAANDVEVH